MTKEQRIKVLSEARDAGASDEYISQQLNESALEYFSGDVTEAEKLDEVERDELESDVIDAYNDGFCFRPVIDFNRLLSPVLSDIAESTCWDNWEADEETGREWKTAEVLHCKLEFIRDWITSKVPEEEAGELHDALDDVQKILKAIADTEDTDYNITN